MRLAKKAFIYKLSLIRGILVRLKAAGSKLLRLERLLAELHPTQQQTQQGTHRTGGCVQANLVRDDIADYRELCLEAFGRNISPGVDWMFWSFSYDSEETRELFKVMYAIEVKLWGKYLHIIQREQVAGNIVEFGVGNGDGLSYLIQHCKDIGLRREIFGFDSFQGLPKPSAFDLHCFKEGMYAYDYEAVREKLQVNSHPNVHLIPGWFSESLQSIDIGKVAFARIDCDLYEPARDCLDYLKNRLSHGSYLIFDDWAHNHQLGETKAFFESWEQTKHWLRFEHIASLALGGCHFRVWHVNQMSERG